MANEVYVSAQGDTLATHIFRLELEMLLNQRPFMRGLASYRGDTAGSNSDTIKVGQIDHDDIAETVAEGSGVSANTPITDSSYTLQPSRRAIKRILSNKLDFIDATGQFNEQALAAYNFNAVMKAFDAAFATGLASLTGTAGTSGAVMTADDFFTATQTMRSRRARGPLAMVLHTHQFNNLQSDLRGEVGPWQFNTEVGDVVATSSGENFIGTLQRVQIWTSDQIADANAGADHGGGLVQLPGVPVLGPDGQPTGKLTGDAAIAYAEGSPKPFTMGGGRIMAPGGVVYTDLKTDPDKAELMLVTNYFVAVGVADAAKGIKVITDHE